jgi:hypothetical protein
MSAYIPSFYMRLGLGIDADERAVKRAYARLVKTLDPETQAAEFEKLRSDYDQALDHVKNPERDYYYDDGEFFFKESSNENAPAHSLVDSPADSPTTSNSPINLNDQSASNLKIGNPEVNENIDQNFTQENANSVYDEAILEFQEFCKLVSDANISELTNIELADFLRTFLRREALTAFEARTHFENLLIEALANRHFGQNSGHLLISSATFFNWNTADSKRLADCGAAGREVLLLLDNFFSLTDIAQVNLLRTAGLPNSEIAYSIVSKLEEYRLFSPQLYSYFVALDHEKAWFKSKQSAPFLQKLNELSKSIEKHITIQHGYWLFLILWLIYKFTK